MSAADDDLRAAPATSPAPERPGSRPARLVRRYLPVVVLLAVAAHQLYRVRVDHLSPWKGGGFGMYSTVHSDDFEVWAEWRLPGRPVGYVQIQKPPTLEARALLARAKLFPCAESLAELRDELPPFAGKMQVWRPYLDPETLEYRRELVAELDE